MSKNILRTKRECIFVACGNRESHTEGENSRNSRRKSSKSYCYRVAFQRTHAHTCTRVAEIFFNFRLWLDFLDGWSRSTSTRRLLFLSPLPFFVSRERTCQIV